nr:glycosyltransferase 87 family protein [Streptomyces lycii]
MRARAAGHPTLIAAVCCLASFAAFWAAQRAAQVTMIDLMVYRAEGWTARTGGDLYAMRATYADLPNTYPPFASLLFIPLTLLDVGPMRFLVTAGNLGLLVALVHLSLRLTGLPERLPGRVARLPRPALAFALAGAAVWCEPVWTTLRYGQINLLLAVLVLWDLSRPAGHRWAGLGTGIAAGVKLTPALFAAFLAVAGAVRGWQLLRAAGGRGGIAAAWNPLLRRAAVSAAAFAGTVATAAVALPRDSLTFWSGTVFSASRAGHLEQTANQSLRGMLARLMHTTDPGVWWAVTVAVVAVAGLAAGTAALLAGLDAWAVLACAMTALLISPVSWSHHWVWCVPLVLLLGGEALRRSHRRAWWTAVTAAVWLVFCSYALWWVPHTPGARQELRQTGGQMLLSAGYPALAVGFLVLTAAVAARAWRRAARRGTPLGGAVRAGGAAGTGGAGAGTGVGRVGSQAVAKE